MVTGGRPHVPMRPAYLCRVCAAPWPCPPARLALLAEHHADRVYLAVYLASAMVEAIGDTYDLGLRPDLARLHARFLGWLARRP